MALRDKGGFELLDILISVNQTNSHVALGFRIRVPFVFSLLFRIFAVSANGPPPIPHFDPSPPPLAH